MKIKVNDNLIAIYTYINSIENKIDLDDFIQWVLDYEYYNECYQNWHIIRDYLNYHNDHIEELNEKRKKRAEN